MSARPCALVRRPTGLSPEVGARVAYEAIQEGSPAYPQAGPAPAPAGAGPAAAAPMSIENRLG